MSDENIAGEIKYNCWILGREYSNNLVQVILSDGLNNIGEFKFHYSKFPEGMTEDGVEGFFVVREYQGGEVDSSFELPRVDIDKMKALLK